MTPAAAQAFMLASVLMTALPACVLGAMLSVLLCARLMLGDTDTDAAVAFTIEYHRAAARHACAVARLMLLLARFGQDTPPCP